MKKQPENHLLDNAPPDDEPLGYDERETSLIWDDATKTCMCYTANKALMGKLDRLCEEHPTLYKCTKRQQNAGFYEFPKKFVSIRAPRFVSEEQREAAAERLRNMHRKGVTQ